MTQGKAQDKEKLTPMLLRNRAGLTQRQVAQALDVREATVSEWERGFYTPRVYPSQIKRMLEVYKCDLDELIEAFEGANEKTAKAPTN
jgi:transcriptional regulator with XRE-family HTH domain